MIKTEFLKRWIWSHLLINLQGHCLQNTAQFVSMAYKFLHVLVSAYISQFTIAFFWPFFQSSSTIYTNCNFSNMLFFLLSFAHNLFWFLEYLCFNIPWPAKTRCEPSDMTAQTPCLLCGVAITPSSFIKCLVLFFILLQALCKRFFLVQSCIPRVFYT